MDFRSLKKNSISATGRLKPNSWFINFINGNRRSASAGK